MFEIGFSELVLVMIVGLIVLGPERLPVAVKTVAGWIRAIRSLALTVQNELTQELKLQELQESLKKVEQNVNLQTLSPELKTSMEELRSATEAMTRSYQEALSSSSNDGKTDATMTMIEKIDDKSIKNIDHNVQVEQHPQQDERELVTPVSDNQTTHSNVETHIISTKSNVDR